MLRSIRMRITVVSTLLVMLVLSVTAVALVRSHRQTLTAHVNETLTRQADELARELAAGTLTTSLTNNTPGVHVAECRGGPSGVCW